MRTLTLKSIASFLLIFAVFQPALAMPKPELKKIDKKKSSVKVSPTIKATPADKVVPTATPQPAPTTTSSNSISGLTGVNQSIGKAPTFIKSDKLSLNSEERTFTYSENVEVTQGDMTLTADNIVGNYDENNKIKQLVAKGNVIINKGPQIRATGERAIYEAASSTVVLTDNPELQQEGSILSADRIRIFLEDSRSVAEGTVRVKLLQKDKAAVDASGILKSQN